MNEKLLSTLLLSTMIGIFCIVFFPYVSELLKKTKSNPLALEKPQATPLPKKKTSVDLIIRNLKAPKIHLSKSYSLTCKAEQSMLFNPSNLIISHTLTCTINKNDHPLILLQGNDVCFNRAKHYLFFKHDVKGTYQDLTLQGQKILFDLKNHLIKTNVPCTYRHPHFSLTASKNSINLKTNVLLFEKGVVSHFYKTKT